MINYVATATLTKGDGARLIASMKSKAELMRYVDQWVNEWSGRVREVKIEKVENKTKPVFWQTAKIINRIQYAWCE